MQNELQKITVIVGPTASGKSDYAVSLALKKKVEENIESIIISADSRQVYRGLDIGSGKINKEEMRGVPHFGLDIVNPGEKFTVNDWLKYTEKIISENKDKNIIICGGTGLYIEALLYGITDNPAPNNKIKMELKEKDLIEVQNLVIKINKEFFEALNNSEKNNKERLIRKLEILIQNTGEINTKHDRKLKYNIKLIKLSPILETLKENIKIRCEKRWVNMLLETKKLIEEGVDKKWLEKSGLEYSAILKYIDEDIKTEKQCKEYIIQKSIQYAKRQITWNKKYENLN